VATITVDDSRRAEGIVILRLDRPDQRNAMSIEMVRELTAALDAIEHEPGVAAVILVGEGKGFCAGSDVSALARMDNDGRRDFEEASGRVARRLSRFAKPVLAAVHGFAMGGGLTLASACDIVVTAPDAKWSLPEVPIGLFPAWGLASVVDRVGKMRARRLAWGIDVLDGNEAEAMGLADVVAEGPTASAIAIALQLAALPRLQTELIKRYFSAERAEEKADQAANRLFMQACSTPEAEISFARFLAKSGN